MTSTSPARPSFPARPGALGRFRICDFTGQLAGAGATKWLAAFGAEVIRIEDPVTHGLWDILRPMGPFVDERRGPDFGGGFNNHNTEKYGITLNLRTERAKEILAEIVKRSDVVSENFAKGVLERWGFGYEQLRADQARHHLRVELRLRPTGPVFRLQDLGPDRAGDVGADLPLWPPRQGARRLGLFVHGPHRRHVHGDRDPAGPDPPRADRRRPVGRHVLHRLGPHPHRHVDPRLHRERPTRPPRRLARQQPFDESRDGTA